MHEQQNNKAADLNPGTGAITLITTINHADYPQHLCVALHPTTGLALADVQALVWLCMLADRDRLSALVNSHFITWLGSVPRHQVYDKELAMVLQLLAFLDTLARTEQLG